MTREEMREILLDYMDSRSNRKRVAILEKKEQEEEERYSDYQYQHSHRYLSDEVYDEWN